jgi:hypothetical protein
MTDKNSALERRQASDYVLVGPSCWIEVEDPTGDEEGNMVVYVRNIGEGVAVDIFANGKEMDMPLTATYASFDEARELWEIRRQEASNAKSES